MHVCRVTFQPCYTKCMFFVHQASYRMRSLLTSHSSLSTTNISAPRFHPRFSSVCININYYLSLIVSVNERLHDAESSVYEMIAYIIMCLSLSVLRRLAGAERLNASHAVDVTALGWLGGQLIAASGLHSTWCQECLADEVKSTDCRTKASS